MAALRLTLALDEVERSDRFLFRRDRERSIVSRGSLRLIPGTNLQREPATIRFKYLAQGKPALAASDRPEAIHFNLAHSGDSVVYTVGWQAALGVDVEVVRPLREAAGISESFFSAGENNLLRSLGPEARTEAFFRLWTRKEAYPKAVGIGLGMPLREVEVSFCRVRRRVS